MANTLTGLYTVIYNAMNTISREMVGFVSAVSTDATAEQAGADQTVRSPVVPSMSAADIVPTNIAATGTDQTISFVDIVINNQRKVSFNLTGEQGRALGATNNATIAQGRFEQAMRTLVNEIETDLAETYVSASRAFGTAGTTPFSTADDLTDLTEALRILDDNGAPKSDRHAVLGSAAVAKMLGRQPSMFRVNEANSELVARRGEFLDMFGAMIHHSGQVQSHTAGAGTGYLLNGAASVGDTTLTLDGGTVNTTGFKAGDVITKASDANKYVVSTGLTSASGDIVIAAPGLRLAGADNAAITIGGDYTANMVFSRDALHLAARVPAIPDGGDQADDRTLVTDPVSGLTFEVSVYRQYRQVTYEVAICWGVKAVKPEHMALLLG